MEQEFLQSLALAVAGERSVASVLQRIVEGLRQQPHVALTRIWLRGPGDLCVSCPMRRECPDQRSCLHLVASAGQPTHAVSEDWSRLNGAFRRFPLTVRKIGHIGATGVPILLTDLTQEHVWMARPEWVQREGIRSFAGQPLLFRDDILGVLAVFSRVPLDARGFAWLRIFADQAAVAIANARAFEEIERLRQQLQMENDYLREAVQGELAFGAIVGNSPSLRNVLVHIARVAPTKATVLITGETGTGKELVARAVHDHSPRHHRPLIKVNCGAVPRELFESEFFGHVQGAFTGALKDRVGRFQLADGGTLFLDEVGEIPLELQSKLLRVLQEGELERVGEERTRRVDVRVIAATNRDLRREVEAGRFRTDLYYRISAFPLEVPPLRQRLDDIPLLATHFLDHACQSLNCAPVTLTAHHIRLLQDYAWPGNIRELQNVIERAVILAQGGALSFAGLLPTGSSDASRAAAAIPEPTAERAVLSQDAWKRAERDNLLAALRQTNGKIYGSGGAAALLGLKPTTLAYRLKVLGIKKPESS